MTTYAADSKGKFIPASQRPDGTWRKARRIRAGYVPQEEVPLYVSKGKLLAQLKLGLPPGMCPFVAKAKLIKPAANIKKSNAINIKASSAVLAADCNVQIDALATQLGSVLTMPSYENAKQNPTKRLKNLRKKLREIEALEAKIANGVLKKPDQDQQNKVKRKKDVLEEIQSLKLKLPDRQRKNESLLKTKLSAENEKN